MCDSNLKVPALLNEITRVKEGSKVVWKVQAPKGILTFYKKKDAIEWIEGWAKLHPNATMQNPFS